MGRADDIEKGSRVKAAIGVSITDPVANIGLRVSSGIAQLGNLQRCERIRFNRLVDQSLLEIGFAAQIGSENHDLAASCCNEIGLNLIGARCL
jgi:hypothetical protein